MRIKHREERLALEKRRIVGSCDQEYKRQAEKLAAGKPRQVLTTHGVVYIAKLVDKLQACQPEQGSCGTRAVGSYCGLPVLNTGFGSINPETREKCTCSTDAKRLRAQFADISPEIVADLSKLDWLGRLLFVFQTTWMIIQCIARLSSGLNLTLLELHAASHATLAALHYLIWWKKPIDMIVMTPLSLTRTQYNRMLREVTPDRTNHFRLHRYHRELLGLTPRGAATVDDQTTTSVAVASAADINSTESTGDNPETTENPRPVNQTNEPESHHVGGFRQWWTDLLEVGLDRGYESTYYFTSQATLGKDSSKMFTGHISPRENPLECVLRGVITKTLSFYRWPGGGVIFFTMSMFYSGIHLVAWDWYFPSHIEQVLWRLCSLYCTLMYVAAIASHLMFGVTWIRAWGLGYLERIGDEGEKDFWQRLACRIVASRGLISFGRLQLRLHAVMFIVLSFSWTPARIFLAVESLVSLRKLPAATYTVVGWTNFIPHI